MLPWGVWLKTVGLGVLIGEKGDVRAVNAGHSTPVSQ